MSARLLRLGFVVLGFVLALTLIPQETFSQVKETSPSAGLSASELAAARATLEGTFALEEWNIGGKALHPPQADGRFSIHDGVILFMTTRYDTEKDLVESVHGWGSYSITAEGWTYGYHYLETVRGSANGPQMRALGTPSSTLLKLEWHGPKLVVIGKGSDHREYSPDSFVSAIGSAGDFRRWRRIQ